MQECKSTRYDKRAIGQRLIGATLVMNQLVGERGEWETLFSRTER
jgi:hypothetical protein